MTDHAPKYCMKCGARLNEGAKFCGSCGHQVGMPLTEGIATSSPSYKPVVPNASQATPALAVATSPAAATRKPWSKRTKIIVAAVATVALVAGVATITVNALMPKNPLALTARSLMTLSKLKQGSFEVSGIMGSSESITGSFKVGKDVQSSVADVTASDGSMSARMAWMDGRGAINARDEYEYYEGKDADQGFKNSFGDDSLPMRDSLVSNGKLDLTGILGGYAGSQISSMRSEDAKSLGEAQQAITAFVTSGLESKDAQSRAFHAIQKSMIPSSSGKGRVHMLYYEISAPGITGVFADWFAKNRSKYPNLDASFAKASGKNYLDDWKSWSESNGTDYDWKVTLTYGNNLQFESLSISPADNSSSSGIKLAITNWNKDGPDEQQVKAFIDTAQRES